jgi:hypothetical protein
MTRVSVTTVVDDAVPSSSSSVSVPAPVPADLVVSSQSNEETDTLELALDPAREPAPESEESGAVTTVRVRRFLASSVVNIALLQAQGQPVSMPSVVPAMDNSDFETPRDGFSSSMHMAHLLTNAFTPNVDSGANAGATDVDADADARDGHHNIHELFGRSVVALDMSQMLGVEAHGAIAYAEAVLEGVGDEGAPLGHGIRRADEEAIRTGSPVSNGGAGAGAGADAARMPATPRSIRPSSGRPAQSRRLLSVR